MVTYQSPIACPSLMGFFSERFWFSAAVPRLRILVD